jgi:hypothetical protein
MERHDWASSSRDCGRAQITQICAHTDGTLTRQPAAPNGGSGALKASLTRSKSGTLRDSWLSAGSPVWLS